MSSIKGTRTEKNLLKAFAGESQARNRYTFYAGKAKKEGFVQISKVFEETADQEKAHASRLYKFLEGGDVEVTDSYPAGGNKTTEENLRLAAAGEEHEYIEMYPEFASIAREEGFDQIGAVFEAIAVAEKQHGKRFKDLADNIAAGHVFKRDRSASWRCLNCGYLHDGEEAPDSCPACAHSRSYFELLGENW
jgi:rubrerythrin